MFEIVSLTDFTELLTTSAIAKAFPTFSIFLPPVLTMFCKLSKLVRYCSSLNCSCVFILSASLESDNALAASSSAFPFSTLLR